MKKKELILANLCIAALIVTFGYLTFNLSLNPAPSHVESAQVTKQTDEQQVMNCSNAQPLNIGNTTEPHLQKLKEYQELCGSFATNTLMVFTGFSGNKTEAEANAKATAETLKQFYASGVKPLVIAEPYLAGEAMSYKAYLRGDYDEAMDYFFARLKAYDVNDQIMGTWVPFPESNTPSWNNKDTEPNDYALCVNKFLKSMKKHFSGAKGSLLLNATTYDPRDSEWENGDYISLSEYLSGIDHTLVDSFGIQGFPWVSNAQQPKRTIFNANEFLQPDFAIGAAQMLRTRDIWINTGTFASKYTDAPEKTVQLSLNERKALLQGILDVAKNLRDYQQNQYRVTINLFSEDKSLAKEATDWSYFQDFESQAILREFLNDASELEIPVSLFDKVNDRR